MRVKSVPPPADLDTVAAAQRAVPLVPGSETDCCARIVAALDLPSRDVARTWLTFLRGLGLVREGELGFVRVRVEPDRTRLAEGLLDGVFGAREALGALAGEPTAAELAVEAVLDRVPTWERDRDRHWRETWRERANRLLEWLLVAGLVAEERGGYVRIDREDTP